MFSLEKYDGDIGDVDGAPFDHLGRQDLDGGGVRHHYRGSVDGTSLGQEFRGRQEVADLLRTEIAVTGRAV